MPQNFVSNRGAIAGVTKVRTKAMEIGGPERPKDLIYALDEIPPWPHLLGLGLQHVAVICPYRTICSRKPPRSLNGPVQRVA
jgi:hypothetical protein